MPPLTVPSAKIYNPGAHDRRYGRDKARCKFALQSAGDGVFKHGGFPTHTDLDPIISRRNAKEKAGKNTTKPHPW